VRGLLDRFTIRARITAGTLAIALVFSAVAAILLYADVSTIIHDSTVQLLRGDVAPLEAAIKRAPTDPDIKAGEGQLAALINPSGHVIASNLPDSLEDRLAQLKRLHATPEQIGSGKAAYLVVVETIPTSKGTWSAVVARNLQPGRLVLRQLGITLVIGAIVLFASLGVASWMLSGAALRPVSRMRREAQRLGIQDAAGALPVGRAHDELAALATTLNEFLARTRQSVEHERQMVSDASHELRTPLAVLVAQLDEATRAKGDRAAQVRAIENASQTATRLSRLTTNLLELSKLDAHDAPSTATWPELVQELSQSIDRARIIANPLSVVVDFEIGEGQTDAVFDVAAPSFGRLVDNLLSNAIAASNADGAVSAVLTFSGSGLTLEIRDQGDGVPEWFIPIAFERFSRPDASRTSRGGGSGLGLAIVAATVAQARGTVVLENLDVGAHVRVAIPIGKRVTSARV
jgi:two-component system OmpR family sensor kinase